MRSKLVSLERREKMSTARIFDYFVTKEKQNIVRYDPSFGYREITNDNKHI